MGKRGPAPTPTAIKLINGERKDRINMNEPKPLMHDNYEPKVELNENAYKHFKELVSKLNRQRVLTENDIDMLTVYCMEFDKYVEAERNYRLLGSTQETKNGFVGISPYASLMRQHLKAFTDIAKQFGFTPSSRSGIVVNKTEEDNPFAKLMKTK